MSGPANKRMKAVNLQVTLDGQPTEVPEPMWNSLVAVYTHLESIVLRRNALLVSLMVDGIPIRLEKPMVPLRLFRRVEAYTARFDDFAIHLVPSLQRKLQQLHQRMVVAAELAIINEWPATVRLWWDLLPDLKEPLLILNLLARLPMPGGGMEPNYTELLKQCDARLNVILREMDKVVAAQEPLMLSDLLEQQLCPWLRELEQALAWGK